MGDTALAETYLSDLVTSAKNGTMGNYDLSALVSLDEEDIKIDEIEAAMLQEVQSHALEQYGIQVHELRLKRVGLPGHQRTERVHPDAGGPAEVHRPAAGGG